MTDEATPSVDAQSVQPSEPPSRPTSTKARARRSTGDAVLHGNRLFFLGAGFSRPAGLPLADDLLEPVLHEVRLSAGHGETKLDKSIDRYRSYLAATTGESPQKLNFEELATYLDHEHVLGLRGSDTWSDEGNEDQLMLRWSIGAILNRMTPRSDAIPDLYIDFARRLRAGDVLVTFNYDLILERSLEAAGVPYRRYPHRYSACYPTHSYVDSDRDEDEVVVLKVHGSIDWVSRAHFHRYYELLDDESRASFAARHKVFGTSPCTPTYPLVEGPRPSDDPLGDVYVLAQPDSYYAEFSTWWSAAPLLLTPSQAKLYYGVPLRQFWRGITRGSTSWGALAVIGYSLPPGDPYTRQVLYELSSGHTHALENPGSWPWPQSRIKVIDYRTTEAEQLDFFRSYRFLDHNHTDFDFGGLSRSSVARVFGMDETP